VLTSIPKMGMVRTCYGAPRCWTLVGQFLPECPRDTNYRQSCSDQPDGLGLCYRSSGYGCSGNLESGCARLRALPQRCRSEVEIDLAGPQLMTCHSIGRGEAAIVCHSQNCVNQRALALAQKPKLTSAMRVSRHVTKRRGEDHEVCPRCQRQAG